jgi:hypothetical protein
MNIDKSTLALLVSAGLPLAVGGAGMYMASRSHAKEQERQKENLRAIGRDLVNSANFGKSLPLAQERFLELSELAPRTMQQRHLAGPLLQAAISGKNMFPTVVERATNIERNLHTTGVTPNHRAVFATGMQVGNMLAPLAIEGFGLHEPAGRIPTGMDGQHLAGIVIQDLMYEKGRPLEKKNIEYFHSPEGQKEISEIASKLIGDPERLHKMTDRHAKQLISLSHTIGSQQAQIMELQKHAPDDSMNKKAALDIAKSASPEAIGNILATQYIMAKTAMDMHKEAFALSPAFKTMLMSAGTAALGGLAIAGVDKGVDLWKEHNAQHHLDSSFDTAFKRVQKGNADDRFAEEVRVKFESDPVRYRQMAREAFDVLAETSPTMAKHPIVARSFINSVIMNDGSMPAQDLTTFSRIHADSPISKTLSERVLPGFRALGGEAAMSAAAQDAVRMPWRETERQWRREDHAESTRLQSKLHREAQEAQAALQYANARKLKNLEHKMHVADTSDTQRHQIALERLKGHMRRVGTPQSSTPISAAQAYNRYKKDIEGNP